MGRSLITKAWPPIGGVNSTVQRNQCDRTNGISRARENIYGGYATRYAESVGIVVGIKSIEAAKPG